MGGGEGGGSVFAAGGLGPGGRVKLVVEWGRIGCTQRLDVLDAAHCCGGSRPQCKTLTPEVCVRPSSRANQGESGSWGCADSNVLPMFWTAPPPPGGQPS